MSLACLSRIHDKSIIHRDLHSGNILINDNDYYRTKIGDLGLSKSATEAEVNETYGIIPYMAPEVLQGQKYTKASDIYSFGMIMWECMTGRRPFWDRAHDTVLIIDICDGLRPPTVDIVAPEGYIELMKECWDPDQSKRPTARSIYDRKATFEFAVPSNEAIGDKSVYTPIFSTADDMFWQLEYQPSDPENPNCCLIFLTAVPNSEEAISTQFWCDRASISASLFIKSVRYSKAYHITTDDYSLRSKSWGKNFNKIMDNSSVIIGVTFENSVLESKGYNSTINTKPESKDIIETWGRELDVPEKADVLFNVKDGVVYASKSILSSRSEYFSGFLKVYIVIDVTDTSKAVFYEMLRYIYTDEVRFNLVSPIELFKVADKYLLSNLRQKARVEIFKKLSTKNAMHILFNEAWQWNDLKYDIMDFIVENFQKIQETPEYKKLSVENKGHPAGIEIFQEIVDKLLKKSLK
ncbi:8253_t:CDS:2 [Funneliformis geosporum]|uniref:8253_t:CDS:1 n=1 Tax=Funneliformis geosporum TaxID=1117311 RepID=A0A9W4WS74_9GLOM|nr:8253_t:CDS:2 [Funneliformis geosporum]